VTVPLSGPAGQNQRNSRGFHEGLLPSSPLLGAAEVPGATSVEYGGGGPKGCPVAVEGPGGVPPEGPAGCPGGKTGGGPGGGPSRGPNGITDDVITVPGDVLDGSGAVGVDGVGAGDAPTEGPDSGDGSSAVFTSVNADTGGPGATGFVLDLLRRFRRINTPGAAADGVVAGAVGPGRAGPDEEGPGKGCPAAPPAAGGSGGYGGGGGKSSGGGSEGSVGGADAGEGAEGGGNVVRAVCVDAKWAAIPDNKSSNRDTFWFNRCTSSFTSTLKSIMFPRIS